MKSPVTILALLAAACGLLISTLHALTEDTIIENRQQYAAGQLQAVLGSTSETIIQLDDGLYFSESGGELTGFIFSQSTRQGYNGNISAWIAISPPAGPVIALPAILLGLAVLFWTAGFDIIYACQDIDIDRRDKLFSIPARFGIQKALTLSRCLHVLAMALLLLLTQPADLGPIYLTALTIVAALLIWQHNLVKNGDMKKIRLAFATLNGCISILLAAAAINDIFI